MCPDVGSGLCQTRDQDSGFWSEVSACLGTKHDRLGKIKVMCGGGGGGGRFLYVRVGMLYQV